MIERLRGKADSLYALEGSRPECVLWQVFRSPPGSNVAADKASI